ESMPRTLSEASDTTTAPTPFSARSPITPFRVRCGYVGKTPRPFSSRMRATVIVLSPCSGGLESGRRRIEDAPSTWRDQVHFCRCELTQSAIHLVALLSNHRAVVRG